MCFWWACNVCPGNVYQGVFWVILVETQRVRAFLCMCSEGQPRAFGVAGVREAQVVMPSSLGSSPGLSRWQSFRAESLI